jgi:hypothetical protein
MSQLTELSISDTNLGPAVNQFLRHHISTLRSVSLTNVRNTVVDWWFLFGVFSQPGLSHIEHLRLEHCKMYVHILCVERKGAVERAIWNGNDVVRARLNKFLQWLYYYGRELSGQGMTIDVELCDAGDWCEEEPWVVWP